MTMRDSRAFVLRLAFCLLSTAVLATACDRPDPPRLTDGAPSLDALSRQFVAAVSARDTAAMHRLRVTARQHNELLWPELPASRLNMPVGFAWFNVNSRSVTGAAHVADRYGGSAYHVVRTDCRKGDTAYETFTVHGDCWVALRLENGQRLDAKLFGSVVEMDGRYKIVGIIVD